MFIREMDSWCPECGCEVTHIVEHVKYKVAIEYHSLSTEYEYAGTDPVETAGMVPYVIGVSEDKHSIEVKVMCSGGHEWTAEVFVDEDEKDRQKDLLAGATDVPPPAPAKNSTSDVAPGFAGENAGGTSPTQVVEQKLLN